MRSWNTPLRKTRHQNIPLRDSNRKPTFVASFRTPRLNAYLRNAAISRRFERDPIPYALETDCPLEAAGFEPPHQEFVFPLASLLAASRRTILLPLFASHDSGRPNRAPFLMRRFESSRPSQPVRSPTIVFAGKRLTSLNQPRQRRAMEHKLTGYPSSC